MTIDTTYAKRIVSTSTGYTCYLGSIEVGTASTYGQAERVCAEAFEDFQHIDPATLAMLAKLTPTELHTVAEQLLRELGAPAPVAKPSNRAKLETMLETMTVGQFRTSIRWMVELHPDLLEWGNKMLDTIDGPQAPEAPPSPPVLAQPLAMAIDPTYAHIATFDDGVPVYGTYDTDGVTPSCVYLKMNDGYFYCSDAGDLAGEWAGQAFDFPAAALPALKALFTSNRLTHLQDIAALWEGPAEIEPPRSPSIALVLMCDVLGYVQRQMTRWGLSPHNAVFSAFGMFVAERIEEHLGNVDYEPMPVLDALFESRLTPEERAEYAAQQEA